MSKIFSERSLEGYLEVDHTNSPGISAEEAAAVRSRLVVPGGTKLQRVTRKCMHCQALVIMNPLRTRERPRCWSCWSYLCDRCAVIYKIDGQCQSIAKKIDEFLRTAHICRS